MCTHVWGTFICKVTEFVICPLCFAFVFAHQDNTKFSSFEGPSIRHFTFHQFFFSISPYVHFFSFFLLMEVCLSFSFHFISPTFCCCCFILLAFGFALEEGRGKIESEE
ncbi:hypothetical protein PIB30_015247 [Stylosanthes scabra]|uniref:Uncharacterized protein n=1 Tax=Stylosanthes scabra TaxID=79078 RepID=A0ABU6X793_9FABA|nr:hypothetical protein [Stylosanthes scabra]